MSAYDDNEKNQMNYISIDNKPKDDLKENHDNEYPDPVIDNKNDYEAFNEKPYYEQKEKSQPKYSWLSCGIFCRIIDHMKGIINDNSENELLLYSLLHLFIQVIIIFIFTLLGFIFRINEPFVALPLANILPTTVVIVVMYITSLCIDSSSRDSKFFYIIIILYIPCMVFYCFALSGATDKINVICGVVLYIFDILSFIISVLIFQFGCNMFILFIITSGLISIIILIIFHFKSINDGLITFKISTVGASEIIYLILCSLGINKYVWDSDYYLFGAIVFDLAIFTPLIVVIVIIFIILYCLG